MNIKTVSAIIAASALNVIIAVSVENIALRACLIFAVTAAGSAAVVWLLAKPVIAMQKRLRKVQAENEELERIRSEFISNVTHELKTPLTSISGFVETLQNGADSDPVIREKFLDIIAIETDRLKRLISDALTLSHIENEKDFINSDIDVTKSIDTVIEMLRPIANEKNISIVNEVSGSPKLKGDPDRFRQMFLNLIENAIKYSDPGGRVWVSGSVEGHRLQMAVSDDGIGIAPEYLDKIFIRFFRVDKARSNKVGGTGLGLSIVKHIASLFGASINVESKPGRGSTFYISFPEQ